VAVGLTTGKILLIRLYEQALREAALIENGRKSNNGSLQSAQYPALGVKMSRPCNAVSFSKCYPNYLAAGLDKVRNDPCLLIWDISRTIGSSANTPISQTPTKAEMSVRGHSYQESRSSIISQWRLDNGDGGK
jgi:hypothetical protein